MFARTGHDGKWSHQALLAQSSQSRVAHAHAEPSAESTSTARMGAQSRSSSCASTIFTTVATGYTAA
jgi:hypothetical protein